MPWPLVWGWVSLRKGGAGVSPIGARTVGSGTGDIFGGVVTVPFISRRLVPNERVAVVVRNALVDAAEAALHHTLGLAAHLLKEALDAVWCEESLVAPTDVLRVEETRWL